MANEREITQKKQRPDPNPDDIKSAVFFRNEKKNRPKITSWNNVKQMILRK